MFEFQYRLNFNLTQLLLLHILLFPPAVSSIRKDGSLQEKHTCRTTVQGRFFIADDNGHVCDAFSVDPQSNCCPVKGDQFSCLGCKAVSQCCNSYEFCVSCCLNPATTREEVALEVKIAKPSTAGTYNTVFDFCVGRCRHNSESVVHENTYLSEFHHCFSMPSNASESSSAQQDPRLAGINVIVGRQGESCDSVCKYNGQSCVPNKLALLNQCETLQKYMSCKGGCMSSDGADQPAEVVDDAPRDQVLACIQSRRLRSPVTVHIDIQGGFALVHKLIEGAGVMLWSGNLFKYFLDEIHVLEIKKLKIKRMTQDWDKHLKMALQAQACLTLTKSQCFTE